VSAQEPSLTRWTKYGHDRIYVTADGTRLGWLDLATGQAHPEQAERTEEFHQALVSAGYLTADVELAAPLAGELSVPEWQDLALNRPGQAAREQAEARLQTQRSRSRLLSVIARALDVKTDERAWRKGADGEESVGIRLEKLAEYGWHVLHSVPVGQRGSDIDHLLIGPGGVFTINTKNHPGKSIWVAPNQIRVDGHVQPYLRNSQFEAQRAARLLSEALEWPVQVRAALVLLTGTLIPDVTIKSGGPADVLILDRIDIPRFFRKSSTRLTQAQVAAIFEQARRSTLWARR